MARWLEKLEDYERQGFQEIVGSDSNPRILKWAHGVGKADYMVDDSKTPWCGIGLAGVMDECGLGEVIPQGPAAAISWMACGIPCEPKPGAIAIFPRDGGHHVTVIKHIEEHRWFCVGCNQRNGICTLEYDGRTALGTRWPIKEKTPTDLARHSRIAAAAKRQERDGAVAATTAGSGPAVPQLVPAAAAQPAPPPSVGVDVAAAAVPAEPTAVMPPPPAAAPIKEAVDGLVVDLGWFKTVIGTIMDFATFVGIKWPYVAAAVAAYFFLRMWWDGMQIKWWRTSDHNEGYTT